MEGFWKLSARKSDFIINWGRKKETLLRTGTGQAGQKGGKTLTNFFSVKQ